MTLTRSRSHVAVSHLRRVFWVAGLALLGVAATFAALDAVLLRGAHRVERSREIGRLARQARALATDRQTAIRGYLLSGDSRSLALETAARAQLPSTLDSLSALTADDPAQRRRTLDARAALDRWHREFAAPVLERAARPDRSAAPADTSLAGKALFDAVRAAFAVLTEAEDASYAEQLRRLRTLRLGAAAAVLLEILALVGVLLVLTRRAIDQMSELLRQQDQLEEQAIELEPQTARLQEQAVELERQMEEAQALGEQLEASNEDLSRTLAEAERARDAARAAEERYQLLVDSLAVGVVLMDATDGLTAANPSAERILGLTADQMRGRNAVDPRWRIVREDGSPQPPDENPVVVSLRTGEPVSDYVAGVHRPDGRLAWIEVNSRPLFRPNETAPYAAVASFVDLTDRKRAEDALRRSEAELRALVESLPDVIMVLSRDGEYRKIAPSAANLLYRPPDELVGKRVHEVLPADAADFILGHIGRALDAQRSVEVEYSLEIEGRAVWFLATVTPMHHDAVLWVARDVTSRKTATEQLRASEERHRLLFERNPFPMWLYDAETLAILAVNDAAVAHYGYSREEFLTMRVADLRPAEDVPQLLASRAEPGSGLNQAGLHRHRKKDGAVITVDVVSDDANIGDRPARLVLARDVTEREVLEAQLRQSQKMEAVGQLAGGVAHDFNNLLTVISSYSEMVLEGLDSSHPGRADLEEVKHAAMRAAGLTRQLLAFSRKQVMQPRVLDLNSEVIAGVEKMLRRLIGEDIELVTTLDPELGLVNADPGQLEQVIVNLAVNARDAMPNGGRLVIETANAELSAGDAGRHLGAKPGRYVMLSVSDTGTGMSKETLSRMFEPFFTTKEQGKGTGLGLATVHGIVKQSGGDVWVYSEPGQGTTFKIYLPRVEDAVTETPSATPRQLEHGGGETILLVEDEDVLRVLARKILLSRGYAVLEARNGEEALSICETAEQRIDLVLTDAVMPGMSGRALAERLGELRPDARVLVMSGYTDDDMLRRGILDPRMAFLQKPFTPAALTKKVREVLDAPSGVSAPPSLPAPDARKPSNR